MIDQAAIAFAVDKKLRSTWKLTVDKSFARAYFYAVGMKVSFHLNMHSDFTVVEVNDGAAYHTKFCLFKRE